MSLAAATGPTAATAAVAALARSRVAAIFAAQSPTRRDDPARSDFLAFRRAVGLDDRGAPLADDAFALITSSTLSHCNAAGKHVNFKSPPQLGKSTDARLFLAWLIGRDVQTTSAIISGDDSGAKDACALCREIVESPAYRRVFPEAIPDVERSNIASAPDSSRRGWKRDGWFLVAAGQRKDPTCGAYANAPKREDLSIRILLADDLITERTANSEAERDRIENAWWNTWIEGRIAKAGGWAIYLQNHRVDGDLGDKLRKDARFCSVFVGVREDMEGMFVRVWNPPAGLPLIEAPERFDCESTAPNDEADWEAEFPFPPRSGWDRATLESRDAPTFRKLYQLRGALPQDLLFPSWPIRRTLAQPVARALDVGERAGRIEMDDRDNARVAVAGGLDISGTGRRGIALVLVARSSSFTAPIHVERFSRIEEAVARIDALWNRGIRFAKLNVENNATQAQIVDLMRTLGRERGYLWTGRIAGFLTGRQKFHPNEGLPGIDVRIASGEIAWPTVEPRESADWRQLEGNLATLTLGRARDRGKTPDDVMALWFALSGIASVAPGNRPASVTLTRHRTCEGY